MQAWGRCNKLASEVNYNQEIIKEFLLDRAVGRLPEFTEELAFQLYLFNEYSNTLDEEEREDIKVVIESYYIELLEDDWSEELEDFLETPLVDSFKFYKDLMES